MRPYPPFLLQALQQEGQGLNVLVVRLGALGDILRTLPPVRLIRLHLPRARIFWLLEDKWAAALEDHPDLDDLLRVPRREWNEQLGSPQRWPGLLRSIWSFRRNLRGQGFELVLDFHGNLRSGVCGWFSGAPVRLGYDGHQQKEGNQLFTTHRVPSGTRRTSRMERNLDLVRALGIPDHPLPSGDLPLVDAGSTAADEIGAQLDGPEGFAILSPAASRQQQHKKPPATVMGAAAICLAQQRITPLVVWGPGERDDAERTVAASRGSAVLAPGTSLAALAALLSRARMFVGGDSGPLHLACAVGCPVVGLYGPTDPEVNLPWGVPFRELHPAGRGYVGIPRIDRAAGGFEGIETYHVEQAVKGLLIETAGREHASGG